MTNPAAWDLFDPPPRPEIVRTPKIEFEAPSAPGSKSSQRAAELVFESTFRRISWRRVLIALYKLEPGRVLSREEISARTDIKECSLCGRLDELSVHWVEVVPESCIAKSTKTVDGYRLTKAGRALIVAKHQPGGAAA